VRDEETILTRPESTPSRPITPVILCGGAGTRLWPLSRGARPKQFLSLGGLETMLQGTAARVADLALFAPPVLVTNQDQAQAAAEQLAQAGPPAELVIVEPSARNTAPAIALAALAGEPDALLLVLPSDHLIRNIAAFRDAVALAAPLAEQGRLVTFGIRPDRAETGYGYIKRGSALTPGAFEAARFVEKPDAVTAASYVESGDYSWNAGIFLFRADAFLSALQAHAPEVHAAAAAALSEGSARFPDAARFAEAPSISVDHAVMEKAGNVAVVPVDMQWSDVGSWEALYEVSGKDAAGNAVSGETLAIDSRDCLLWSDGPLVTTIGVEGLAVIATEDAILVVPLADSQRVKEAVALLAAAKSKRL
jgi:mannose-1-phosphate guanylyltransferase